MSVQSRIAAGSGRRLLTALLSRPTTLRDISHSARLAGGHARNFNFKNETLLIRRVLDGFHFYVIGLGLIPMMMLAGAQAILSGHCRLEPEPEDRVPRYWEYEDTPLKQMRAWLLRSPVMMHEMQLAQWSLTDAKRNLQKRVARMEHLAGQRLDYKAFYHVPMKTQWMEIAQRRMDDLNENSAAFVHYNQLHPSSSDMIVR